MGDSGLGDSSAMTIDFLRARLLSERSVSRTARQRAEQLAKRVAELEEQLRIVTIQRRKAEKAAAEVLVILENQGIGNFSEVVGSSSDQDDVTSGLKGSDATVKDDESSATSRMEKSEVDDGFSGSDTEVSRSQGRSLSWKGNRNDPESLKKKMNQSRQRHRRSKFLYSAESSPKPLLEKSCRKIKRKDKGDAAETVNGNNMIHDAQAKKDASLANEVPNVCLDASPDIADGFDKDEEMERALEKQAELIDQYQAEENAQREWEAKFNENNCSTMGFSISGLVPAIAEDKNELRGNSTQVTDSRLCHEKEEKISGEPANRDPHDVIVTTQQTFNGTSSKRSSSSDNGEMVLTVCSGSEAYTTSVTCSPGTLHVDTNGLMEQKPTSRIHESEIGSPEFEFPAQSLLHIRSTDQVQVPLDDDSSSSSSKPCFNRFLESHSRESLSQDQSNHKFSKAQWSIVQHQLHKLPQAPSSGLGGVLDALQRAKLSLMEELCKMPQPARSAWSTTSDAPTLDIKSSDTVDIPIGSAGLFRLPTDSLPPSDLSRLGYYSSGNMTLTGLPSNLSLSVTPSSSQYPVPSYSEIGSRLSVGRTPSDPSLSLTPNSSQYSVPSYPLIGSRIPVGRSPSDLSLTANPSSSRYPVPSNAEVDPRIPVGGLSNDFGSRSNSGIGLPPMHTKTSMYPRHHLGSASAATSGYDGLGRPHVNSKFEPMAGDRYSDYISNRKYGSDLQRPK